MLVRRARPEVSSPKARKQLYVRPPAGHRSWHASADATLWIEKPRAIGTLSVSATTIAK